MAYHFEGKELVLDGFNEGISDNPFNGINDMRGMNVISIPGEACVSFAQNNVAPLAFSGTVTSADAGTDTISYDVNTATGTAANYIAVTFSGGSLPAGITAGTVYWVLYQGISGSFKIYSDCYLNTIVNITSSGTGTFTSVNMGAIRYFEKNYGFCIDENGRCWTPTTDGKYSFMNNTITNGSGNGLVVYKGSGSTLYLFVFRNAQIDYTVVTNVASGASGVAPSWVSGWNPVTGGTTAAAVLNTNFATNNPHEALVGQDNRVYFTDASYLGSFGERPGATFDPTNTATYTWNQKALSLPYIDTAQCLEELNTNLLVGGIYNFIYPWDRISTSFKYPILIAEKGVTRLLTVNTNTFIFAGSRGRIFVTNGSQANLYKKMPDHILGIEPSFTFYSVGYNKNQIYFGIRAKNNAGTITTAYAGLWAIDIDTESLRAVTLQSTTTATVTAMWSNPYSTTGFGLATAWKTVNSSDVTQTAGIDTSTSSPYTTYTSYIDTEMVPIGQFLNKATFNNLEFKLSTPLVSGEGIKISYRTNKTESFTLIGETTAAVLSDAYTPNFEGCQWIQLRIETKSTSTNPSFVRLTEIRLRTNA